MGSISIPLGSRQSLTHWTFMPWRVGTSSKYLGVYVMPRMKPRASCMLRKYVTTELHPSHHYSSPHCHLCILQDHTLGSFSMLLCSSSRLPRHPGSSPFPQCPHIPSVFAITIMHLLCPPSNVLLCYLASGYAWVSLPHHICIPCPTGRFNKAHSQAKLMPLRA